MFTGELAVKFRRLVQLIVATTRGLMKLFPVKEGGIFTAQSVQYDLMQEAEAMSIPVKRGDAPIKNTGSTYQTVIETPPYYSEAAPLNVADLAARFPGTHKYAAADVSLTETLLKYMASLFAQIQRKVDRGIEWQASQILQTGKIEFSAFAALVPAPLTDIDFLMHADMFPTTSVTWDTATGKQMRDDLVALCDEIRKRGKKLPTDVILGRNANTRFWNEAGNLAKH